MLLLLEHSIFYYLKENDSKIVAKLLQMEYKSCKYSVHYFMLALFHSDTPTLLSNLDDLSPCYLVSFFCFLLFCCCFLYLSLFIRATVVYPSVVHTLFVCLFYCPSYAVHVSILFLSAKSILFRSLTRSARNLLLFSMCLVG